MIYLDTSVVLAALLAEDRKPPTDLWEKDLISSRLLEYEVWVRLHARGLATSHGEAARDLIGRMSLVEMSSVTLGRALSPFPVPLRTLDALHLATLHFLRERRVDVALLSYDHRQIAAAEALGVPLA